MKIIKFLPYALIIIILALRISTLLITPDTSGEITVSVEGEPSFEVTVSVEENLTPITEVYDPVLESMVDLDTFNGYSVDEFTHFSGIGSATAEKIYNFIKSNGPLDDFRTLTQVNGIGEKKLAQIVGSVLE